MHVTEEKQSGLHWAVTSDINLCEPITFIVNAPRHQLQQAYHAIFIQTIIKMVWLHDFGLLIGAWAYAVFFLFI